MVQKKVTAKELEKLVDDPETQERVSATFQKSLEELQKRLPRATDGTLLNSRMDF